MKIPTGREDIAVLFKNCLEKNRLAQTYIIHGDEGMGKKTIMRYILSLVMCQSNSSCDVCSSCKSLAAWAHPDVVELRRTDGKASIGVDSVRSILSEVYIRPVLADYKAVVVHEAHLLTAEAQNAMLKIIEEPPERVVFFLLCDTLSTILQTVLSRSVTVALRPLSNTALTEITGEARDFELNYSMGNVGRLKSLLSDSEFASLRDEVIDNFSKIISNDAFEVYESVKFFDKNKDSRDEIFNMLLIFSRDILYKKLGMDSLIINKDKINQINAFAKHGTAKAYCSVMRVILSTQIQKGKNGNYTMAVTTMLFKCREVINGRSNRNTL